jgi:hypothetical protein
MAEFTAGEGPAGSALGWLWGRSVSELEHFGVQNDAVPAVVTTRPRRRTQPVAGPASGPRGRAYFGKNGNPVLEAATVSAAHPFKING